MHRLAILLALVSAPALATDYYVRTDGNDANTGLANDAAHAWASPHKCLAAPVTAGDRCLIQEGSYLETANMTQAIQGTLDTDNVRTDCTCTKGAATITCGSTVSGVDVGEWVRCDGSGPYFAWTRVASVAGTVITLDEAYRGESAGPGNLDNADFLEIRGLGDVVITNAQSGGEPAWTQHGTYADVWYYSKAGQAAPWTAPGGFREVTPIWDTGYRATTGRDPFIKLRTDSINCPCGYTDCAQQVHSVPGSWCDDGTYIYLHTRGGVDPATVDIQAGRGATYGTFWNAANRDYTALRNFTLIDVGPETGYNGESLFYAIVAGGDHSLFSEIETHAGQFRYDLANQYYETQYEHLRVLDKSSATAHNGAHSGLRFYDVENRGGYSNGMNFGEAGFRGLSSTDRIVFDRVYLHRTHTYYRNAACGAGGDYWDCTNYTWQTDLNDEWWGVHGNLTGSSANTTGFGEHVLVQNSIVEITSDGWQHLFGSHLYQEGVPGEEDPSHAATDVTFRNNTIGWAGSQMGNWNQEIIGVGAATAGEWEGQWGVKFRNNIFTCDSTCGENYTGSIIIYGGQTDQIDSDYNLWLFGWNTSNMSAKSIWRVPGGEQVTFPLAIQTYGQEAHSIMVCGTTGTTCSGTAGTYYNDGAAARAHFVQYAPTASDWTTDLTPTAANRGVNAGDNSECPSEDFYGNPRDDGHCDMGAVEYDGGGLPPSSGVKLQGVRLKGIAAGGAQ